MFAADKREIPYTEWNGEVQLPVGSTQDACLPKADVQYTSGASVVIQYLEALRHRVCGAAKCSSKSETELYAAASEQDKKETSSDGRRPTLKSLMESAMRLGYVKNCKIAWFRDMNTLKRYLREYGFVVVELRLTTSVRNACDFEIQNAGKTLCDSLTKGFVVYRIDENGVLLQNTLGIASGILGFNRMPEDVFSELFVKGGCFAVEED